MSLERKIFELESELRALKASTSQALEQSWRDVERVRKQIDDETLCFSERSGTFASDNPSLETTAALSSCDQFAFNFVDSPHRMAPDDVSILSSLGKTEMTGGSRKSSATFPGAFASFRWPRIPDERQQTRIEQDLMRQLAFLQENSARCVLELEVKLKQREAAIATLETALKIKDDTVRTLRDEIEALKIKSDQRKQSWSKEMICDYSEARERRVAEKHKAKTGPNDSLCTLLLERNGPVNRNDARGVRSPSGRRTFETPARSVSKSPSTKKNSSRRASPFSARSKKSSYYEN